MTQLHCKHKLKRLILRTKQTIFKTHMSIMNNCIESQQTYLNCKITAYDYF